MPITIVSQCSHTVEISVLDNDILLNGIFKIKL